MRLLHNRQSSCCVKTGLLRKRLSSLSLTGNVFFLTDKISNDGMKIFNIKVIEIKMKETENKIKKKKLAVNHVIAKSEKH